MVIKVINYNSKPSFNVYNGVYPQLIKNIENIATLRVFEPNYNGQIIMLLGHTISGLGGGHFRADLIDAFTLDDDGTVIITTGFKRWKRILNGQVDSDMYGGNAKKMIESADTKNQMKLMSDFTVSSTIRLRSKTKLDCNGFKFIPASAIGVIDARGGLVGNIWNPITADMLKYASVFVSAMPLNVGDWVFMRSEAIYTDPTIGTPDDPAPVSKYGQIFKITQKIGNTYSTDFISKFDFKVSDLASVIKINPIHSLDIKNLKINDENYTTEFSIGFRMQYVINGNVKNPLITGSKQKNGTDIAGRSAIKLLDCVNVNVDDPETYHIGWYGIELGGANRSVKVNNIYAHDNRHAFSFNWLDGYGKSINCNINGGIGDTCNQACGDTHANSTDDCSINDFIGQNSKLDSGIQIRSTGVIVNGGAGINNALDGIVGRGIGEQANVHDFTVKNNKRNGINFFEYGVNANNPIATDNALGGIVTSSGTINQARIERNSYAFDVQNSVNDDKNLTINGAIAPQSIGRQTLGIFFRNGYDASRCHIDNNHFVGYGDFVFSAPNGQGNNYIPTSNKNNKTHNSQAGSLARGRHAFTVSGAVNITTSAFRNLIAPTGTRGGGQISRVILAKISGASGIVVDYRPISNGVFEISASGACEIEWAITGI